MEDVIFGGSDARKPTGAAEVRLKLGGVAARVPGNLPRDTNGPQALVTAGGELLGATAVAVEEEPLIVRDVEVMRRLYRSGESEYLIDGESVRLRDVQDLLMDAGLGIKAYAVIEQGKIGQILSARPDRSPAAHRRSRRRDEIQEPAPGRGVEARGGAAEPDPRRRHRVRGRKTARRAEAAGCEGATLPPAARRAAALGEGAVRCNGTGCSEMPSKRRARGSRMRGHARPRLRHTWPKLEASLERLRLELMEADGRTTAAREAAHASELEIGRLQQQIAFDKQQVESLAVTASDIRGRGSDPRSQAGTGQDRT